MGWAARANARNEWSKKHNPGIAQVVEQTQATTSMPAPQKKAPLIHRILNYYKRLYL